MVLCASCKNKTSLDQCTSHALKGLLFCGKHIKTKHKRLWSELNINKTKIILIQKIWRGYFLRHKLALAGPGVLDRKNCHNTEELVTLDDKNNVSPLDYFSFMEADKLYWFDIRSLYQYARACPKPANPYTRQELTIETRHRLRKLCQIRVRSCIPNIRELNQESKFTEIVEQKWLELCQIIEENGFFDTNHLLFMSLNKTQLYILMNLIHADLIAHASGHAKPGSRREKYLDWSKATIAGFTKHKSTPMNASYFVAKTLLSILNDSKEQYTICFIIISAIVRL